jgi:hypothetical protein
LGTPITVQATKKISAPKIGRVETMRRKQSLQRVRASINQLILIILKDNI